MTCDIPTPQGEQPKECRQTLLSLSFRVLQRKASWLESPVEKHLPPPSTCPQSHHPTPRGEICYLLWNKTFTVWLSLKWFTNYFGVFYSSGRYCCFPCLLKIVCDELGDVVAGLPGWSGVVFPLNLVLTFPILDSFIEDTCQQWTKVNSYIIRFFIKMASHLLQQRYCLSQAR